MTTRLGQIGVGVGRYLGFLPKNSAVSVVLVPNQARTITVSARQHALLATARNLKSIMRARARHFIVREEMIYQLDSMHPGESPIVSLDIRKELALNNDTITSVTTAIEVGSGTDADVATRLIGSASATGTIISQRVSAAISGVSYNLKFIVTTPLQVLIFVMNFSVDDEGAFD